MKAMAPDGQAVASERKRRLRDPDYLMDRDLYILEWMYGGQRISYISKILSITPSMTYRRIREIPDPVKVAMERLVRDYAARGVIGGIHNDDKDAIRKAYRKYLRSRSHAA